MLRILLTGCGGRMGRNIINCAKDGCEIVAGVDKTVTDEKFPIYTSISDVLQTADVIVDFSNHAFTCEILDYAVEKNIPCVICTTGHGEDELAYMKKCSEKIAIFQSGNMSLGINVIIKLASDAARALGEDFDVEIIEKHHRNKLDAPSGTALMIAEGINSASEERAEYVYARADRRQIRPKREIGISSIRGGDIVGEHEVLLCGGGEVISIKHTAENREVFAHGALRAAEFIADKTSGMYTMKELIAQTAFAEA